MGLFITGLIISGSLYLNQPPVVHTEITPPEEIVEMAPIPLSELYILTGFSCYDPYCVTASGGRAGPGMVAANNLDLGTKIRIDGLGDYVVLDRCGGCVGAWLDVWFPSREEEVQFGRQEREVMILEGGE